MFFIWGSTCLGCLIFTWFFIPETKGLSLEQVDLLYQNSSIIGSNKYRRQLISEGENHPDIQRQRSHLGEQTHPHAHHDDKVADEKEAIDHV